MGNPISKETSGNFHEEFSSNSPTIVYVQGNLEELTAAGQSLGAVFRHSFSGYHSFYLPQGAFATFIDLPEVKSFRIQGGIAHALTDSSKAHTKGYIPIIYKSEDQGTYTGKGVVVGIIDTGIDLDHPDFKSDSSHTRVVKIWDQARNLDSTLRPTYGYGEVYDSAAINAGNCPHTDPNQYHGHGTMVSGIAVGNGHSVPDSIADYSGYAAESPILYVASDFSASSWTQTIADGVDWIFAEAEKMGMPCVVNISAGTYSGSHDGRDLAAQYIDSLIQSKKGRAVVSAAGNAGHVPPFHLKQQVNIDTTFTWFKVNPKQRLWFSFGFC